MFLSDCQCAVSIEPKKRQTKTSKRVWSGVRSKKKKAPIIPFQDLLFARVKIRIKLLAGKLCLSFKRLLHLNHSFQNFLNALDRKVFSVARICQYSWPWSYSHDSHNLKAGIQRTFLWIRSWLSHLSCRRKFSGIHHSSILSPPKRGVQSLSAVICFTCHWRIEQWGWKINKRKRSTRKIYWHKIFLIRNEINLEMIIVK